MLQVDTYIDDSTIHGKGIFANQNIEAHQVIWTMSKDKDVIMSLQQVNNLSLVFGEEWKKIFMRYSYHEEGDFYVLHTDNIRFINHSENANCGGNNIDNMIALRNICRGEELTENYNVYREEDKSYRACAAFMQKEK